MGKIICIWGCNGCGKTTLAVNLAGWLATRKKTSAEQKVTALISAADYAEIPAYFGLNYTAEQGKGLKAVLANPAAPLESFYVPIGNSSNSTLYLLSPAPGDDAFELCEMDRNTARRIILGSRDLCDVVVIDAASNKNNAITGEGLAVADAVIIPIDGNVGYPAWYRANGRILDPLNKKTVFVKNKDDGHSSLDGLVKQMGIDSRRCKIEMQYVQNAPETLSKGDFLYKNNRSGKIYEGALTQIWEAINIGK